MAPFFGNKDRLEPSIMEKAKDHAQHTQSRMRVISFVVPTHVDEAGFDFGVVYPFTGISQPTLMEPISHFISLPVGVDWQDVLGNIGRPLFTLQEHTPELQQEIYVPSGMGHLLYVKYMEQIYDFRKVPQNRDMSLLDLMVTRVVQQNLSLDWLFDPDLNEDSVLIRLGFKPQDEYCADYQDDPWFQTAEEVHRMLRHLSGQGMRRQGDFSMNYGISVAQLPKGELGAFLKLPLSSIEHHFKGSK